MPKVTLLRNLGQDWPDELRAHREGDEIQVSRKVAKDLAAAGLVADQPAEAEEVEEAPAPKPKPPKAADEKADDKKPAPTK